jgi:hypothetical protein
VVAAAGYEGVTTIGEPEGTAQALLIATADWVGSSMIGRRLLLPSVLLELIGLKLPVLVPLLEPPAFFFWEGFFCLPEGRGSLCLDFLFLS